MRVCVHLCFVGFFGELGGVVGVFGVVCACWFCLGFFKEWGGGVWFGFFLPNPFSSPPFAFLKFLKFLVFSCLFFFLKFHRLALKVFLDDYSACKYKPSIVCGGLKYLQGGTTDSF